MLHAAVRSFAQLDQAARKASISGPYSLTAATSYIAGYFQFNAAGYVNYRPVAGIVNLEIAGYADAVPNRLRELREDRARRLYGLPPDSPVKPRQAGLFTIAALAQRIGVGERTLRYWEMGMTSPTARHRRALARELGVSVEDLGLDEPEAADHHGAIVEAEG